MSNPTPWISLVALSEELLPTPAAIAEQLLERFADAPEFDLTSESERGVTFTYGEATGNVTLVDKPIPWQQLEGPCEVAWYWPEAAASMRGHTSHLFVTLLDPAKDPVDRAVHLTQLTTALAATTPSVGIVWGPSSMVHKPVDFAVMASQMTKQDLPLHLWVDFRVAQQEDGTFVLFTTGMEPLGHQEFEVARFAGDPKLLAGTAYNIAHYVLTDLPGKGKPVLKDGQGIGLPDENQVSVRLAPSLHDPEQEVMRLEFE